MFRNLGKHVKAKEYFEKALAIAKEIGERKSEGTYYGNLRVFFISHADYVKAKAYLEKA